LPPAPLVYVVNEPLFTRAGRDQPLDLSPACVFGQLRSVLPPGRPPSDPDALVAAVQAGLVNFTERDFLLLIGDPVAIGVATVAAVDATGGPVKMLRWESRARCYRLIELDLGYDEDDETPELGVDLATGEPSED
jgi:hypothetical protein